MSEDWKDKLAFLKENLDSNTGDESQELIEKEKKSPSTQTLPLNVVTDRKGRNGKIATIIEGFTISQPIVDEIAKKLKKKLGVGGSTRQGEILIQGDHKEVVKIFLKDNNFKVK